MNRKSIRLIKRNQGAPREQEPVQPTTNPNKCSTAVRSWIHEFQQRDRSEVTLAFDSLFKDAPPESTPAE